jgi:hypothetical protein
MDEFVKYFLGGLFLIVSCSLISMAALVTIKFIYLFFKNIWDNLTDLY